MGLILTRVYLTIILFPISNITYRSSNETFSPTILPWTRISTKIKIQINIAITLEDCMVPNCLLSLTEAHKRLFALDHIKRISVNYRILLDTLLSTIHIMINSLLGGTVLLQTPRTISILPIWRLANMLKLLVNHPRRRKKNLNLKHKKLKWIRLSRVFKVKIKIVKLVSATKIIQEWVQDHWDQIILKKFSNSCQYWRKLKKKFNWKRFWSKS